MNPQWNKLTGKLDQEERKLVSYVCSKGLRETRSLLKSKPTPQTQGAVLAFETIDEEELDSCEQFIDQWKKLGQRCAKLRNQSDQHKNYWNLRGQQLQLDFIIERLLAYRVITHKIKAAISARAGLYVGEWLAEVR